MSKLRVLEYLSNPLVAEKGCLEEHFPVVEPGVTKRGLLADMLNSGLVERGRDASDARSKPYFITEEGSRYLEDARQNAMFPEFKPRQDWSASETSLDTQKTVSDLLRALPEFKGGTEDRIQEVSQQVAQILSQSAGKPR